MSRLQPSQPSAGLGIQLSVPHDRRGPRAAPSSARGGRPQNTQDLPSPHLVRTSEVHQSSKIRGARILVATSEPQDLHASPLERGSLAQAKSTQGVAQYALDATWAVQNGDKGQRAAAERLPDVSTTISARSRERRRRPYPADGLVRHGTLLSSGVDLTQNANELNFLLGNANSRLKHGALVLPEHAQRSPDRKTRKAEGVPLERAKSRSRVEVDINLENNMCVQGEYLRGHVKIRVRKPTRKEAPVMLADGKVRVIGFECIPSEDYRHTFYQCGSALSAITGSCAGLYESPSDTEGFAQAREGIHSLPFAMHLSLSGSVGTPKGAMNLSGVAVRYIAMISIKVKDSQSWKRSIAHFYRDCEIWPRLDPSTVLSPASRPIQETTTKSPTVLTSTKLKLTASLHRGTWVSGQRCYVKVCAVNTSKKRIRSLTLTLIRTTMTFKPRLPGKNDEGRGRQRRGGDDDNDGEGAGKVQTRVVKEIAESVLEMGQNGSKGHASAKGWWTGVAPGQELEISHFILIPHDALSVPRERLIQVEYTLRVSLSAGTLSSPIAVSLPLQIVNFLSIDPLPSDPLQSFDGAYSRVRKSLRRRSIDGELDDHTAAAHTWPTPMSAPRSAHRHHERDEQEELERKQSLSGESALHVTNPDAHPRSAVTPIREEAELYDSYYYESDGAGALTGSSTPNTRGTETERSRELGNMMLEEEEDEGFGTDEEIGYVVGRVHVDETTVRPRERERARAIEREERERYRERERDRERRKREMEADSDVDRGRRRSRPQVDDLEREREGHGIAREREKERARQTGFAQRVREKLAAVAAADTRAERESMARGDVDGERILSRRRYREARVVPVGEDEEGGDSVVIMPTSAISERGRGLEVPHGSEDEDDAYGGITTSTLLDVKRRPATSAATGLPVQTRPPVTSSQPKATPRRPPRPAVGLDLSDITPESESTSTIHTLPYLQNASAKTSPHPSPISRHQPNPTSRSPRTPTQTQTHHSPTAPPAFLFRKVGHSPPSSVHPPPPSHRPTPKTAAPLSKRAPQARGQSPAKAAAGAWLTSPNTPVPPPISAISSASEYSTDSPVHGRPGMASRRESTVSERIEELEMRVRASRGVW